MDRFSTREPGRQTRHSFSFGAHYDPERVSFGPLNDGHPAKLRLEAQVIGSGKAWIASNGKTIAGTWKKTALTAPTQFFDAEGNPVTLTVGQTFVQVMKQNSPVSIKDGAMPGSASSAAPTSTASAH